MPQKIGIAIVGDRLVFVGYMICMICMIRTSGRRPVPLALMFAATSRRGTLQRLYISLAPLYIYIALFDGVFLPNI